MLKARKYVAKKSFEDLQECEDFEVEEYDLPALNDGQILTKAVQISIDRVNLCACNENNPLPYDQLNYQVAEVIESMNPDYPVGTKVVSPIGWCDYAIITPDAKESYEDGSLYKLPELEGLPQSLVCGAEVPDVNAYYGFLAICKPMPDETVVVTNAAGAVGSLVGQVAKINGCKVIGFVDSDDKIEWLENELGFDKAFNYKAVNVIEALRESAPDGIDCYFDNDGGEISSSIVHHMNDYGRVSVYRGMSVNNTDPIKSPFEADLHPNAHATLRSRSFIRPLKSTLRVEKFSVARWGERFTQPLIDLTKWMDK